MTPKFENPQGLQKTDWGKYQTETYYKNGEFFEVFSGGNLVAAKREQGDEIETGKLDKDFFETMSEDLDNDYAEDAWLVKNV
jgi:hypothetical protein